MGTTVYSEAEKRNFNAISQAQLGQNFFYMALYRCRTYAQGGGDFFVSFGPSDQLQHSLFRRGDIAENVV
ncbi:MAG TPA: hypothetical protein VFQ89_03860 [Candidatus Binatia bacterium]|nr:hypothetical protein [Candidatus Binatia bacterium]